MGFLNQLVIIIFGVGMFINAPSIGYCSEGGIPKAEADIDGWEIVEETEDNQKNRANPYLIKEGIKEKILRVKNEGYSSLRIKHSGDGWRKSYPLKLADGVWDLEIQDLKLPPGYYEYTLTVDNLWQLGPKKVLYITSDSSIQTMPPYTPQIIQNKDASPILSIRYPNTTYLAITLEGDNWEIEYPLKQRAQNILELNTNNSPKKNKNNLIVFRKPNPLDEIKIVTSYNNWVNPVKLQNLPKNKGLAFTTLKELNLPEGKHEFRFLVNNQRERSPNRVLWVDRAGDIQQDQPGQPEIADTWDINIKNLNLKPGKSVFRLVTAKNTEPVYDGVIHTDDLGNIIYPYPYEPRFKDSKPKGESLKVFAPNSTKVGIIHSGDDWQTIYELDASSDPTNSTFELSQKILDLSPGDYEFKLVNLNEPLAFVSTPHRPIGYSIVYQPKTDIGIGEVGTITVNENNTVQVKTLRSIPENSKINELNLTVNNATSVALKPMLDWSKTYKFKQQSPNKWLLDTAMMELPLNKRVFFKLIIDGNEEKTLRSGYLDSKGNFTVQREDRPPSELNEEATKVDNSYFGLILNINPTKGYSTKETPSYNHKNKTIYYIDVPSFSDSKVGPLANDRLGDLKGIESKIKENYFDKLSINTLWLSPIFKGESSNFSEVNKDLGNTEDLETLFEVAHSKNIKILLELPKLNITKLLLSNNKKNLGLTISQIIYWLNLGADGVILCENFEVNQRSIEFLLELNELLKIYESKGYPKTVVLENLSPQKNEEILNILKNQNINNITLIDNNFVSLISNSIGQETSQFIINYSRVYLKKKSKKINNIKFFGERPLRLSKIRNIFGKEGELALALTILLPGSYAIRNDMVVDWDTYKKISKIREDYTEFFNNTNFELNESKDKKKLIIRYKMEDKQLLILMSLSSNKETLSIKNRAPMKVTPIFNASEISSGSTLSELDIELSPYETKVFLLEGLSVP